jgi:probable rRNA maturation factor
LGYDSSVAVSIAIVNAEEMAELNFKYRGKEGPTNVLSFAQNEGLPLGKDQSTLGDIVICADRAEDDAADLGYTTEEMVLYLLIHGVLHLKGYDHQTETDAAEMANQVEEIFHKYYP